MALAQGSEPESTPSPAPPSPTPTATPSDAELLETLRRELDARPGTTPAPAAPAAAPRSSLLTVSNAFNPAMSVNGLFLGRYRSLEPREPAPEGEAEEAPGTGMAIQEVEFQFRSNVDAYFTANLSAAMEGGESMSIEEAWLQPFWQPYGLSFRAGKMKAPIGRENWQHAHALPFVDRSLALSGIFGEEGLSDFGVEASWLAPTPWYLLLTALVLDGTNERFASERGDDFVYLGSVKSLLDLSEDATFEIGGFGMTGNDSLGTRTSAAGAHVFLKWRPARHATTRGLTFVGEWLHLRAPSPVADPLRASLNQGGGYAYLQARLGKRFHAGARFDYLGEPLEGAGITRRASAILVFAPTEFSAIRLQGSEILPPLDADPVHEALLQFNFTLGAHPAHAY